jgi:hypothetical protein
VIVLFGLSARCKKPICTDHLTAVIARVRQCMVWRLIDALGRRCSRWGNKLNQDHTNQNQTPYQVHGKFEKGRCNCRIHFAAMKKIQSDSKSDFGEHTETPMSFLRGAVFRQRGCTPYRHPVEGQKLWYRKSSEKAWRTK